MQINTVLSVDINVGGLYSRGWAASLLLPGGFLHHAGGGRGTHALHRVRVPREDQRGDISAHTGSLG